MPSVEKQLAEAQELVEALAETTRRLQDAIENIDQTLHGGPETND